MPSRRGRAASLGFALILVLVAAGCGRDDFANDPRPAVPAEVTVRISEDGVQASPPEFGAGLVNFTVANLSEDPATLLIEGPTTATSDEIPPGGFEIVKAEMETGSYELTAEGPPDILPYPVQVGPDRESGQHDLLLP